MTHPQRLRGRLARVCLGAAFGAFVSAPGASQAFKLNDPLPRAVLGVGGPMISPRGERVVYQSLDQEGARQLSSALTAGRHSAVLLTAPFPDLVIGVYPGQVGISPDGRRVLYVAEQEHRDLPWLYSVPIEGGSPPIRLNGPGIVGFNLPGGPRPWFQISSDSRRVVYIADVRRNGVKEIFSVPIEGGAAPLRLNGSLNLFQDVLDFEISPDGRTVVYQADQDQDGVLELYSVPIEGGTSTRLVGPLAPGQQVSAGFLRAFEISPDSRRVVYTLVRSPGIHLFSVPIDRNQEPIQVSGFPVAGGSIPIVFPFSGQRPPFAIDPLGSTVVYVADHETDDLFELFRAPIAGGVVQKLSAPLPPQGDVAGFVCGQSPGGIRVVYWADAEVDERLALYSVPLDASTGSVKLSRSGVEPFLGLELEPGKRRVVFAVLEDPCTTQLLSVPVDGTTAPALLTQLGERRSLSSFRVSSKHVVYRANQDSESTFELYSVPIQGAGRPIKLNDALEGDRQSGSGFGITPDGTSVVYSAAQESDAPEIYGVSIDRSRAPVKLNAPLTLGHVAGDVVHFQLSSRSDRAVYLADQESDEVYELYSVPLQARARATRLNGPLVTSGDVGTERDGSENRSVPFEITPDGAQVVYAADQEVNGVFELFRVPVDGGAAPVRLHPPFSPEESVQPGLRISPDGSRVLFATGHFEGVDFFSLPLTGGVPAALGPAPQFFGGRMLFQVSSDGVWAVYGADPEEDGTQELYSVRVDGSTGLIQLSGPRVPGGLVSPWWFHISPDGGRVVYEADQDTLGIQELYSVPIDSSAPPVKLNGQLIGGGRVAWDDFRLSPDGRWVVYLADQDTDDVYELYTVPLDASAVPVRISGPLVPGGDVAQYGTPVEPNPLFQVSPDSRRVVYIADQDADEVYELYSTAIDGSQQPVRLNAPLVDGGDVPPINFSFQISSDGQRVAYIADQDTRDVSELYSVPIDASASPIKLSSAMESGFGVNVPPGLQLSRDGRTVVYLTSTGPVGRPAVLSAVPIDGSAKPRRLHQAVPFGSLARFEITPDGRGVVFQGALEQDGVFELFLSFLGGRTRPQPVPPKPSSGR